MTREDAQAIVYTVTNHWANSEDIALVRAGYQAAMGAAAKYCQSLAQAESNKLPDARIGDGSRDTALYIKAWLDQQGRRGDEILVHE